jgi:hypothetical protein
MVLSIVAVIGWCAEDGMSDPKFIQSALSRTIREDGIEIRKPEATDQYGRDHHDFRHYNLFGK